MDTLVCIYPALQAAVIALKSLGYAYVPRPATPLKPTPVSATFFLRAVKFGWFKTFSCKMREAKARSMPGRVVASSYWA
jgi:hypothetical protein